MTSPATSQDVSQNQGITLAQRFSGITQGDYVRDALAAILLLVSLTMPTTFGPLGEYTKDGLYVLAIVFALVALVFPYVSRFGLLPKSWTVSKTRAARIVLVLPLVALYLWIAVINHFVADVPDLGVGIAFAFGGAGAALAAQARESELGPHTADKQAVSTARLSAQILAFAIVAGSVGTLIYSLVKSDASLRPSIVMALLILANGAVLAGPALATVFKNTAAWRVLSIGLGIAFLAILYFAGRDGSNLVATFEVFKPVTELSQVPVSFGIGIGLFIFPAFAAVVSSPAFTRGTTRNSDLEERLDLAAITMRVLALVGAAFAVTHLAWGALVEEQVLDIYPSNFRVESIVAGLLGVAVVVVALAALRSFNKNPSGSRPVVSLALVVSIIIGAVLVAVNPFGGTSIGQLLLLLALPAIGAYALIGNKASRAFFEQSAARRQAPDVRSYQWTEQQRPVINAATASAASANTAHTGATATTGASAISGATANSGTTADTAVTAASTRSTHSAATGAVASTAHFEPSPTAVSTPSAQASSEGESVDAADDFTGSQSVVTEPVSVGEVAEDIPDESTVAKVATTASHDTQAIDRSELAALENERAQAETGHGYTYEQAKDPATPAIVLAKIAELAPELRPALAENPSTYPALVEWLGQLGDPAVDAALGRRAE